MVGYPHYLSRVVFVGLGSGRLVEERDPAQRFVQMAWHHNHNAGRWIYPVCFGWTEEKLPDLMRL